ncbi:hypothetical protein [Hyphomicrobium sp.]|jgi:hypothetical protein|uniref:hypothetical protein n=1 Tax=Hyphomicrobium sp. TaxID=82 RepID=UPI002BCEE536|nr:hypothetical protein [Hyphomicrobium sp.]HVZ03480.1 hypothetical protein [Hyphomicrobium sp.]
MRVLGAIVSTVVLLIVELVLTILVYTALNVYSFEFFGKLVRLAGAVLETMGGLVESFFAGSSSTAYASLFGELGPKSMLLLLIGLIVAAVVRLLTSLVWTLTHG